MWMAATTPLVLNPTQNFHKKTRTSLFLHPQCDLAASPWEFCLCTYDLLFDTD